MKIVKTILFSLLGLTFINAGLNKFLNYIPVPQELPPELLKDNEAFAEISWLMPLIAAAELLGGLLILIPKMRALGALILFPVMFGILLTHIFVEPTGLPMAIALWVLLIWIVYDNKQKFLPLIK